ncbi:MAG: hypothetical protein IPM54_24810 [Polyangiaceae bacterium]|nr:hypothetical protein [Polyangiaceae bacterium]
MMRTPLLELEDEELDDDELDEALDDELEDEAPEDDELEDDDVEPPPWPPPPSPPEPPAPLLLALANSDCASETPHPTTDATSPSTPKDTHDASFIMTSSHPPCRRLEALI